MSDELLPKVSNGSFPEPVRVSLPSPDADTFARASVGERRRDPSQMEKNRHVSDMPSGMRMMPSIEDPLGINGSQTPMIFPPFWVVGYYDGGPKVIIWRGVVCDHVTLTGDALVYFDAVNIGTDAEPVPFPVATGDAVLIKVEVNEDGSVQSVNAEIMPDPQDSIHYFPPDPDGPGSPGTYYYKLCTVQVNGDEIELTRFMMGSNIEHYRDLPIIMNTDHPDGIGVMKQFDPDQGHYLLRKVRELSADEALSEGINVQIRVEEGVDTKSIRVRGNGNNGSITFKDCDGEIITVLEWEDGLITSYGHPDLELGCDGAGTGTGTEPPP